MPHHKAPRERKLPVQQLSILAICRFAEPIATTSLFPYVSVFPILPTTVGKQAQLMSILTDTSTEQLPEMVKSFNVPEDEIGKWAGVCSAMFSICQAITGVPWGRFSDQYGRKAAILLGLFSTMITSLVWGFSTNLTMAITARGLAGAGNGNIGIIRTTVAEMVPFKELQPRAFSLMPLVWNIGSIFGPMIGGALANPYNIEPREHVERPNLLQRFPYALPNIVSACFFLIGIITGILYLNETLETRANSKDYGRVLGRKLSTWIRSLPSTVATLLYPHRNRQGQGQDSPDEHRPLLKPQSDEEASSFEPTKSASQPPSYGEVLNKQAVLNLVVYTLLALHTMAYDQLLPVFMHYPPLRSRSIGTTTSNPLKFAGGFGLNHFQIGLISTVYGICGMAAQFLFFPPLARRYGVLNCLKCCAIAFPIAYFITPFTALLPTENSQIAGIFAVMLLKCFAAIFAFPSSTILLTNSANSLRVLGTLNGFATSFSAIGRAIGPFCGGALFTIGVKNDFVIAPWWMFSAIGIVAAIPVWYLIEGEGFGGDDDGQVSDEEEVDDDLLQAEVMDAEAEASGKPGPVLLPRTQQPEEQDEYDQSGLMFRTNTVSSRLSLGSALTVESTGEGASAIPEERPQGMSRRRSIRVKRQMSTPFGMGNQGVGRRYSSNLGQSLGSAGSYHGHG